MKKTETVKDHITRMIHRMHAHLSGTVTLQDVKEALIAIRKERIEYFIKGRIKALPTHAIDAHLSEIDKMISEGVTDFISLTPSKPEQKPALVSKKKNKMPPNRLNKEVSRMEELYPDEEDEKCVST